MTLPAVILYADRPAAQYLVGGLPLVTRHIRELHKLGVRRFYLCGVSQVPQAILRSRVPEDAILYALPCTPDNLPQQVRALLHTSGDLLLARGDCLIDPRLFGVLLTQTSPHWLPAPGTPAAALPAAARLSPELLEAWAGAGLTPWLQHSPMLDLASLDNYSPSHRGPVPFYVLAVNTPVDAETATRTLIRTAQKRALDLPAVLIDPFFENRLVFWLCNTRVTPNQVTLFTTVLGALIAGLFLNGWLRLGSLLTYAVEVLDGVDGKLARTKLQTSRFGELEHVLDFFIEQAWYLSLTIFLVTSTGRGEVWWIGGGLMVCGLLDNLLYYAGQVRLGKLLDELGPFDRGFRLIGGRRNIYAWMFVFGFWAGVAVPTLVATLLWAILTVIVHGSRLVYHVSRRSAGSPAVAPQGAGHIGT
jgi:phosphatidylglycerophosphate synthase